MEYLKFEKDKLINLEYSLNREILRSNRAGSYACTTLAGCNTRKYHGLLVCPLKQFEGEKFVLLSGLDETVIQHDTEFHLGIHKYQGDLYVPKGHKYIRDFDLDWVPKTVYRVGGVVLTKERILVEREEQLLIRYTLEDAKSPTRIRLHPILAFRNVHELTKANMDADTKIRKVENGIASKMYPGFPSLYMQLSRQNEYVHFPDWYYNVEYLCEKDRGYDYKEDLFVPGYFEFSIRKGDSIIFSASTKKVTTSSLTRKFTTETGKRTGKLNLRGCLLNAAEQFIVHNDRNTDIIAGYPWLNKQGREAFMSLPALTLLTEKSDQCKLVLDTMIKRMKNGLFPQSGTDDMPIYDSADTSLWFILALQRYADYMNETDTIWNTYSKTVKVIIKSYLDGIENRIQLEEDGLLSVGNKGISLSWMNAMVKGKPVAPRYGKLVEINALWYNAVCFVLELARTYKDQTLLKKISHLPDLIKDSFKKVFWNNEKGYLADYINEERTSWKVRPNQLLATSLPYIPIDDQMAESVISRVKKELLTPRGLRTLSPEDPDYKGIYFGNHDDREIAYHQGTVWPWLLEFYCRGYIRLYKKSGIQHLKDILEQFETTMQEHGVGTISEIYDGDPPHQPRGAISYAPSVASMLTIMNLIEQYESK